MPITRNPSVMAGSRLKISITIDPDQVQAIDDMATRERTSRAALFRRALDLFLVENISDSNTDERQAA